MKKLLHIAAHMGGGAGKAISGIIKNLSQYDNTLLLLEQPVEMIYINECLKENVNLVVSSDTEQIKKLASESDAVIFDWWFHPLSVNVLNALDNIDVRLLLWSHINGIFYPYLPYEFINLCDGCMFTSPCVFENDYWTDEEKNKIKSLSEIVYGMGEFNAENNTAKEDYDIKDHLKIGYSGTLNFSKMNEAFPEICERVHEKIPDVNFEFYGKYEEKFKKLFNNKYVEFKGYNNNLEQILPNMDIYCYPLTAENFATTENALLEAMAAGLPVVVLNNPAERCIVCNNETGLIAENKEQIIQYIQTLYSDKEFRKSLGKNAREQVIKKYSFEKNLKAFNNCVERVLKKPKSQKNINNIIGKTAWEIFEFFCYKDLDEVKKLIRGDSPVNLPKIYFEENKSSFKHFYRYFSCENLNFKKIVDKLTSPIPQQVRTDLNRKD